MTSTSGVYLITDKQTGALYIGSATGAGGFWGRWSDYAKRVHGGNVLMIAGLETQTLEANNLQFSILQTLGNLASKQDGLDAEQRWKLKFGRKAITLNGN